MALLEIEDLWVRFPGLRGPIESVRSLDLSVGREKLGIVGESGSGKSCTGRSILRLLPKYAAVTTRRMVFDGIDLAQCSEREMRGIRGRRISMIMQDPKFSLNPVMKIGRQIAEAYLAHAGDDSSAARRRTLDMLAAVRIRDPERIYNSYPHELSAAWGSAS